jgi:hypothetical protein
MMTRELHQYLNEHTVSIVPSTAADGTTLDPATDKGMAAAAPPPFEEFYSYEKFTQMHNDLRATQIELQEIKSMLRESGVNG